MGRLQERDQTQWKMEAGGHRQRRPARLTREQVCATNALGAGAIRRRARSHLNYGGREWMTFLLGLHSNQESACRDPQGSLPIGMLHPGQPDVRRETLLF